MHRLTPVLFIFLAFAGLAITGCSSDNEAVALPKPSGEDAADLAKLNERQPPTGGPSQAPGR